MKNGDIVEIDLGYKTVTGIITRDEGDKYITVKHDNFAGEVFRRDQVIQRSCQRCGSEINLLETFPNGLCVDCYEREYSATPAQEFETINRVFNNR